MLDQRKLDAARLVAEGKKHKAIAGEIGISPRTLTDWRADPEFQAEVGKLLDAWREQIRTKGHAHSYRRIHTLNGLVDRLLAVIGERAKHPGFSEAPGGTTGLLTVTYKMRAGTRDEPGEAVPEYAVDTGLIGEIRALNQHIAIEMGDWKEKREISGKIAVSEEASVMAAVLSTDELEALERRLLAVAKGETA